LLEKFFGRCILIDKDTKISVSFCGCRKNAERIYGGRRMTRENQTIEWKESWRDEYLRWISGFANGRGGVLVIGRNDRGKAVGVSNGQNCWRNCPIKSVTCWESWWMSTW
jgi:hypothetical protein